MPVFFLKPEMDWSWFIGEAVHMPLCKGSLQHLIECALVLLQILKMYGLIYVLTTFLALDMLVVLLSVEDQKALGFNQKYLNVCSED